MRRLSFLLLLVMIPLAMAQESVQDIRRQIKAVEKEAAYEKDLAQNEKKRHGDFQEISRKKMATYDEQASSLKAQIDSLKVEGTRLDDARQKASGTSKWVEQRKLAYQEGLVRSIEEIAPILEADVPFKNMEAATTTREIASQLRKGVLSPEEALGRVFDQLIDRIQMGYTTENWSGYFAWQGRSISGKFVRYGAVSALFISQDGAEVFWLARSQKGYEWKDVGGNTFLRNALKEALKVSEGQSSPALVLLPFATAIKPNEVKK